MIASAVFCSGSRSLARLGRFRLVVGEGRGLRRSVRVNLYGADEWAEARGSSSGMRLEGEGLLRCIPHPTMMGSLRSLRSSLRGRVGLALSARPAMQPPSAAAELAGPASIYRPCRLLRLCTLQPKKREGRGKGGGCLGTAGRLSARSSAPLPRNLFSLDDWHVRASIGGSARWRIRAS